MTDYALKLKRCGYPEFFRKQIICKANSIYEKKLRYTMITNNVSLYRDPVITKSLYRKRNANKPVNWCNMISKKLADDIDYEEKDVIVAPLIVNQNPNTQYISKLKNILTNEKMNLVLI